MFRVFLVLFEFGKCFDFVLKYFYSFVFIKVRGDRLDVKNVVVIVIDGVVDKGYCDGLNNVIFLLKVKSEFSFII